MKNGKYLYYLVFICICLTACQAEQAPPLPTMMPAAQIPSETAVSPAISLPATNTPASNPQTMSVTFNQPATFTPQPLDPQFPTPSPQPPAPNPYTSLTIDALTQRSYGGGQLDIIETMEKEETFTRYLITYPSDGLTIYGFMNVPNEGDKFPVVLALHGYIDPDEYGTLDYTTRYADELAEAGYFVIHPNFRNYPPSDSGPNPFRTGYAIDVLNLIAIIREQSQDPTGYLRRADTDNIHLWGHSMGGGVALRVITVNNADYLRGAVLYASMSGNEAWNYERIQAWSNGHRGEFEASVPADMLAFISPINYLDRVETAVSIHHSSGDTLVPIKWSQELCQQLQMLSHPVECFFYEGLPHTFYGQGDDLLMSRTIQFFKRY